jgi:hypothetical protein
LALLSPLPPLSSRSNVTVTEPSVFATTPILHDIPEFCANSVCAAERKHV